jgi:hypothetical protein
MPTGDSSPDPANPFLGLMEALSNRHGEMNIRLEHVTLRLPMVPEAFEVNGTLTVSVHLRELSEKERSAHAAKQVRSLAH